MKKHLSFTIAFIVIFLVGVIVGKVIFGQADTASTDTILPAEQIQVKTIENAEVNYD